MRYQKMIVKSAGFEQAIKVFSLDLLNISTTLDPVEIILDKGTLDAIKILQGQDSAKKVVKQTMNRFMAPHGVYLNITMFIPEMKRIFSATGFKYLMCQLEYTQERKSRRGRSTHKTQWYSVYIAATDSETFRSLTGVVLGRGTYKLPLQDARTVKSCDLKPGAGFFH
jgi:predicted glycosyl hydrolase (DUF1957 family)